MPRIDNNMDFIVVNQALGRIMMAYKSHVRQSFNKSRETPADVSEILAR
jgi:hypothetical protein